MVYVVLEAGDAENVVGLSDVEVSEPPEPLMIDHAMASCVPPSSDGVAVRVTLSPASTLVEDAVAVTLGEYVSTVML